MDENGNVMVNDNANVGPVDIMAKNGIIHVIDAVLLPPEEGGDDGDTMPPATLPPSDENFDEFDDEFGDTYGIIYAFTADGFSHRELRDHVNVARDRLLAVPDVSKIEMIGAQDEQIFIEFSVE